MKKLTLFFGLFLVLSSLAYATTTTDILDETPVNTEGGHTEKRGMTVHANNEVTVDSVGLAVGTTATECQIYQTDNTLLSSSAAVGRLCTFGNVTFYAGEDYYVIAWSKGGSYTITYKAPATLPENDVNVNWVARVQDSGGWENNTGQTGNILNITSTATPVDNSPPVVSSINCTSCDVPNGDTESPYGTYDTTPTFKFDTDENAWCRMGNQDLNWSTMGSDRDCSLGEGNTSHTCTLKLSDELRLTPTDYAYISCKDLYGNENVTSGKTLEVSIAQIQYNASKSIEKGIVISIPSATIYSDQQVYVRTSANNQALATFDKVAMYGSQRWAFNYVAANESSIGAFYNLSPVFYFLEMINLSTANIRSQVSDLINSTKT